MIAAADAAQYGEPPPPELRLAWRIQQWGPPDGNGWNDWPAGQLDRMSAVLNVYNAMMAYVGGSGNVEWMDANPAAARTVTRITKWRMELD